MIITGDCREIMARMEPEGIDAIVTDPPYDLTAGKKGGSGLASVNLDSPYGRARIGTGNGGGFMGKAWDATGVAFDPQTWQEAFRVAKPGAYLLAFGGTRTYHRMTVAIEDAGWEIRDCLVWAYASGFPKSHDVSKAIDKAAGAEREIVGVRERVGYPDGGTAVLSGHRDNHVYGLDATPRLDVITAPSTPKAEKWAGWGTALKPAWEPIVMARKPLTGTVAANVQRYGTGALNIDATRIEMSQEDGDVIEKKMAGPRSFQRVKAPSPAKGAERPVEFEPHAKGRWPANVILTDPIFDGEIDGVVGGGETGPSGVAVRHVSGGDTFGGHIAKPPMPDMSYADSGTYSRFFLIPKASRADREPVLSSGLPEGYQDGANKLQGAEVYRNRCAVCDANLPYETKTHCDQSTIRVKESGSKRINTHPTVKPLELMRHLVRLVTPPGGIVLDPFLGSGTTAIAAELEGFEWIGIELDPESVTIAEARLNGTQKGFGI